MNAAAADWYPDPQGQHEFRFFDGRQWTSHVSTGGQTFNEAVPIRPQPYQQQPYPQQPYQQQPFQQQPFQQQPYPVQPYQQQPYAVQPHGHYAYGHPPAYAYSAYPARPRQSVWVAFILTFFFGPLGMFYSTVPGAVTMLAVSFFFAIFTLGFSLLITWPICIIWGMAACD